MNKSVKVGDGATIIYPQDRYPLVISRVSPSGKTAWAHRLTTVDIYTGHKPAYFNGPYPVWNHTYTEVERQAYAMEHVTVRLSLRKDGTWRLAGTNTRVTVGDAVYYRNFAD